MKLDFNDENLYKPECRVCGPFFVNCCLCLMQNIAECLLFLRCDKNPNN